MQRQSSQRNGRLKTVASNDLELLAELLAALGVPKDCQVGVRITRYDGFVRNIQLVHPTENVDAKACQPYREQLDNLNIPRFGMTSLQFSIGMGGEILRIKKLVQEESVDLDTLK